MALNWSVEKVENVEEVCFYEAQETNRPAGIQKGESYLTPLTNALINYTMALDMNGIKEKTVEEFVVRMRIYDRVFGTMLKRYDDVHNEHHDREITLDEVRKHVGLRTNVTHKSRTQWLKKIADRLIKTAEADLRNEAEEAELAK